MKNIGGLVPIIPSLRARLMTISMKIDGMENQESCSLESQVQIMVTMKGISPASCTVLIEVENICMMISLQMRILVQELVTLFLVLVIRLDLVTNHQEHIASSMGQK